MFWGSRKNDLVDEQIANNLVSIESAFESTKAAFNIFWVGFIGNLLVWILVIALPESINDWWIALFNASNKWAIGILGIPVALFTFAIYGLLKFKFPDLKSEQNIQSEFMGSFEYQASSNRKYFIWIGSLLAGLLNVALMITLNIYLLQ